MCRLFLMTVALLGILFGLSGLYMMPKLVQQKIEQKIQLKIGTKTFDRFTRIPIPLTVKFHLFNITNSEQVLAGTERPRFQEVGPFIFKQWRRRDIVDIIDNNRKITYKEYKTFYASWPYPPPAAANISSAQENDDDAVLSRLPYLELDNEGHPILPRDAREAQETLTLERLEELRNSKSKKYILNPSVHKVTLVNLPLLTILNQLASRLEEGSLKWILAVKVVSRLITEGKEKILVTKPASELLFNGYKVGLLEAAADLISNTLGYNFDSPLLHNKFGFFYNKNGTWSRKEAGEMTVFTGRNESMSDFMLVDNWNGQRTLSVWPKTTEAGNRCNEVRGTDGSQFHPGVTRTSVLDIFSPMICTSIFIKYKEDTSVRDIPLLRFTTPPDVFAAPKKNPRNACYCTIKEDPSSGHSSSAHSNRLLGANNLHTSDSSSSSTAAPSTAGKQKSRITDGRCYIDGLMDLSLCQRGAPIAASGPHFYNADPMLAMAAGLTPKKALHETYLDIEPMTGAVFRAASRAQLNALVEQAALDVIEPSLIGNMTSMVAPLLWLEEAASIDEKSSREFKSQLLSVVQKGRRTFYYAIVLGCLLVLVVAVQYWYVTCYAIDGRALRRGGGGDNDDAGKLAARRRKQQVIAAEEAERSRRGGRRPVRGSRTRRRRPGDRGSSASRSRSGSQRARNIAQTQQQQQQLVPGDAKSSSSGRGANDDLAAAAGLLAAATLAGAADAAVTSNQRRRERERRRTSRRPAADYDHDDDSLERDEDDKLSARALVDNEWAPANQSSGGEASSPVASTSGGETHHDADEQMSPPHHQNQLQISETDFD